MERVRQHYGPAGPGEFVNPERNVHRRPMLSDQQFADLSSQLETAGGFTVNPRTGKSPSTGWMVGQRIHTHVEPGIAPPESIKGFTESRAVTLSSPGGHLGGWRSPEGETHLDVAHRKPETPAGRSQARRALVATGEQESFKLSTFEGDVNPTSPETKLGQQFPEFSGFGLGPGGGNKPMRLRHLIAQPEIKAWIEGPRDYGRA